MSAVLPTTANRGRFLRWLGSLGERGSQQQEAASVSSLLGRRSATMALSHAVKNFRAMPLESLTREHLMDNKSDHALEALTVSADLGEVEAFLSHSWHDDGSAKFDRLREWAVDEKLVDELVWLEYLRSGSNPGLDSQASSELLLSSPRVSSKACIDQLNIDQCLEGLPIFLAGCSTLLVLAGPTYATRLWVCAAQLESVTGS